MTRYKSIGRKWPFGIIQPLIRPLIWWNKTRIVRIMGEEKEEPMKKTASSLFAACLSFGLALGLGLPAATTPAQAGVIAAKPVPTAQTPVENVQYREWQQWPERNWRDPPRYRHYRYDRPPPRRWRDDRGYRPRHYRPAPRYRGGNPHVRWCFNRYRSYRAYDNTFQPNYGPRRQCYSPYL